jgi:hypothetical protein
MKRTVVAALIFLAATAAFAGTSYRFDSVVTGMAEQHLSGTVKSDNGHMRMDVAHGDGMLFADNSVTLSTGDGKFSVYDPSAKTYYELSLSQLTGSGGSMMDQLRQMFSVTIANPKVSARDLGDGGKIENYPTRHRAIDMSYDLNVDAMGQKMTVNTTTTMESWTTDKLPEAATSILQMRGTRSGIPELDKLLESAAGANHGFPLKEVVKTHVVQNGAPMDITQTTTVSSIETKAIPASEFVAPQGYTKVENPIDRALSSLKQK